METNITTEHLSDKEFTPNQIISLIPAITLIYVILGNLFVFVYYDYFGVFIYHYVDVSETLCLFIPYSFAITALIAVTIVALTYFNLLPKVVLNILIIILSASALLIYFYTLKIPLRFFTFLNISIALFALPFLLNKFKRKNVLNAMFIICLSVDVYAFFILYTAHAKENTLTKSRITLHFKDTSISTSDSNILIGKTKQYFFILNKEKDSNKITIYKEADLIAPVTIETFNK